MTAVAAATVAAAIAASLKGPALPLIEIGANLTDPVFRGLHHHKRAHVDDFDLMLARAWAVGVQKIIITASTLEDTEEALQLCRRDPRLFTTIGVHPCRAKEFEKKHDPDGYLRRMIELARAHRDRIVAVGEFGLDYDRLFFTDRETQLKYFEKQFQLVDALPDVPLFLHNRNTGDDFVDILRRNRSRFRYGVVHSFTGSADELQQLLTLDLHIGTYWINGCSLKTEENCRVASLVPSDRLMLETDAPWCEIRKSHAAFAHVQTTFPTCKPEKFVMGQCVRGRVEPCHMRQVLEAVAGVRGVDPAALAAQVLQNTERVFFPHATPS